jgi:archaemetzincin
MEPTPVPVPSPVPLEALMSEADQAFIRQLRVAIERVQVLEEKLEPPRPGDWLSEHFEAGQTFDQYLGWPPISARGDRNVIFIQPLGGFPEAHQRILDLTVAHLEAFFCLPIQVLEEVPLSAIPQTAQRVHPEWGDHQILTTWVLYDLLQPRLPENAAAMIALTANDLWPGKGWNFVFGQASTRRRVGVWSIYRNGEPGGAGVGGAGSRVRAGGGGRSKPGPDEQAFRLCLRRTMKTAAHEIAHIFGIAHEQRFSCLMNGSNHREESDRRPLWLCPRGMAKVCLATGADPVDRYRRLASFYAANQLQTEAVFCQRAVELLEEGGWPP